MNTRRFLQTLLAAGCGFFIPVKASAISAALNGKNTPDFLSDFDIAYSRCAATAIDAGVSQEELLKMITAFLWVTRSDGDVAGNTIKTIIIRLNRPYNINKIQRFIGSNMEGSVYEKLHQLNVHYVRDKNRVLSALHLVGGLMNVTVVHRALHLQFFLTTKDNEYCVFGGFPESS